MPSREAQLFVLAVAGLCGPAYFLFQIQDQKTFRSILFSALVSIGQSKAAAGAELHD
jgi:hypothetical protein